jgi:hypothetical protein
MATLWVVRRRHTKDPLLAALDGIRQAVVAREAEKMGLCCQYEEYEDEWVDMAVRGPVTRIAEVIRKCASWGISGFVIAVETESDEKEAEAIERAVRDLDLELSVVNFAS